MNILTKLKIHSILFFICYTVTTLATLSNTYAITLIRDTEIENSIKQIAYPLFSAADLSPENIDIYIAKDNNVNAFVAGGQNIFFNTGLITLSTEPDMLIGVLAHETGHITGGHLLRMNDSIKKAQIASTISSVLGIGAAALGAGEVGTAIIAGGSHVSERKLLKHSRENEQAADQSALLLLDKLQYSSKGLNQLMEYLDREYSIKYGKLNPYSITHPLSRERMSHIEHHMKNSPFTNKPLPPSIRHSFKKASVKLKAFLSPSEEILEQYPETDKSAIAHYARSIAYYKLPNLEKSLTEIDYLIHQYPTDPYYPEMKGQILFENGKIREAIPLYQRANKLLPKAALIKIQLARALIATDDENNIEEAIPLLEKAVLAERENSFAWHQLAIAYGRNNQLGLSNLALAEEAIIKKKTKEARKFIEESRKYLKEDSPSYLRTYDLLKAIKKEKTES